MVHALSGSDSAPTGVMLYGAPGPSVERLALYLCRSWLCKSSVRTPCGECVPCRTLETGRCVDFQKIEPYGPSRLIKMGAVKPVVPEDEFRGVPFVSFFQTRPLLAARKVVWMDEPERLQHQAAHAVLKTLEEMHDFGRVLMTTSDLTRVIPTIRSRCVLVPCGSQPGIGTDGLATRFASTERLAASVQKHSAAFEALDALLRDTLDADPKAALRLAERFRDVVDKYAASAQKTSRAAHLDILEATAQWFVNESPESTVWVQAVAVAHRRVQGNVSAASATDALFLAGSLRALEQDMR